MREPRRAQRRFAGQCRVRVQAQAAGKRPLVVGGQLHEQVVRMLQIVDGVAGADLAGGDQVGIAAAADRPRLGAEHRPNADPAAAV